MEKQLTVFEENGKLFTDSREVAEMVGKPHNDLMKSIRSYVAHLNEGDFSHVDFFVESSYMDIKGEERPCYQCTKKGCDMIANKLQGKKGVIFTAKYIDAFDRMAGFIQEGINQSASISFVEQVECVGIVGQILKTNDAGKVLMLQDLYESYDLPCGFLPHYTSNGNKEYKSATEQLKRIGSEMSARAFNTLLIDQGYLEEKTRNSRSSSSGMKRYKSLTDKGLKYGENMISPQNQRETQPMYYSETFEELYNKVTKLH